MQNVAIVVLKESVVSPMGQISKRSRGNVVAFRCHGERWGCQCGFDMFVKKLTLKQLRQLKQNGYGIKILWQCML